jgi:hypothetical protein
LPLFELPSTSGKLTRLGAFRQRQNLLQAVLPDVDAQQSRDTVEALIEKYAVCQDGDAEVQVIAGGSKNKKEKPGDLVADALERLHFINLQCPECGVPDEPPPAGKQ